MATSVVAALVSGVISFYVAHWQSQDALTQAVISQQVQQLIKLEADAQSFDAAVYTEYVIALECRKGSASACNQVTGPSGDKMVNAEFTLDIDKGNISDTFIRKDIDTLIDTGLAAASPGSTNENSYGVTDAYFNLTARCGRLIQDGDGFSKGFDEVADFTFAPVVKTVDFADDHSELMTNAVISHGIGNLIGPSD